jgi:hypothetical protein
MTLVEFLLARLDEEESAWSRGAPLVTRPDFARLSRHMLADVEAKRRLIARAVHTDNMADYSDTLHMVAMEYEEQILPALALPYADHPEYQQEWKP